MSRRLRFTGSVLALAPLCACGGGGGGVGSSGSSAPVVAPPSPGTGSTGSTTPSPPSATPVAPPAGSILTPESMQPVRSANDTAEYRRNYVANELVNALYAADNGWTGKGVVVGVVDDGVGTDLPALAGQVSDLSKDFGSETADGVTKKRGRISDDKADHGTAIAAIIAARRDDAGTVGLAPDAKIAALRISDYDRDTGTESFHQDAAAIGYAADARIRVVNRSLSSQGFNPALRDAVADLGAAGGLLVNAAGNSGGADPIDAVNVTDANRTSWLFVVALDTTALTGYALAGYSNKAGGLSDRTVTAAGTSYTTKLDGTVGTFSGTSSAAAQASGLAALILGKWPQLSGVDAGKVILATARDIGEPGVDVTFGHGLIDVRAALAPVDPKLDNGANQTALAGSVMAVPGPVGMGSLQTALSSVTLLDGFGRDFQGSVAGLVVKPEAGRAQAMRRRVALMAEGGDGLIGYGPVSGRVGYASRRFGPERGDVENAITSGEVAYATGRSEVRFGFNAQDSLQADIMVLAPFADGVLAYAPQADGSVAFSRLIAPGRLGVTFATGRSGGSEATAATLAFDARNTSLRLSWIEERGSVFGAVSSGALALGRGATTAMAEAHRRFALAGGWAVEGYGSIGVTRLTIDPLSVVTGATRLLGTRAGLQASGPALGGVLSFGVAQPLTIESGRATLTLGSGYDLATRSLIRRAVGASLATDERRVQWTMGFARDTGRSSFRLGVSRDLSDGTAQALAGYRIRF